VHQPSGAPTKRCTNQAVHQPSGAPTKQLVASIEVLLVQQGLLHPLILVDNFKS